MVRWIVQSSLKLPILIVAVIVGVMYAGYAQAREMPVDVLPEFTPVHVEVQSEALGLSAIEVEQLITSPMETLLLNGVPWLDEIHSESITGLSSIVLTFEPGTDPLRARQVVQERLSQGRDLPNVSKAPVMLQPLSSTSRVMMVRLDSKELSPIALSVLARWTLKPALQGVPGVANVSIWGQREQQMQVHVDPEKLAAKGVTLNQVVRTSANALWVSPLSYVEASTPGTGGFIDTPNQRLGIQHILPIKTPADLAKVTLEGSRGEALLVNGKKVLLGEVASVVENHQVLIGDAVGPEQGLMLVIEKFPEANALQVTENVESTLSQMAPGLGDVEINTSVYRPATFIDLAVDNLTTALLIGLALVLLTLALLYSWRLAVIAAVCIPLSLLAATLVLSLTDTTMNTMVLAGLAIALVAIIDDVIVDVDNIRRRLSEAAPDTSRASIIGGAVLQMRGPLFFGMLIMFAAVLPVFFLGYIDGLTSDFFIPLVAAYVLALLASFAVALAVTPVLMSFLHRTTDSVRSRSAVANRLEAGYDRLLGRGFQRPLTAATTFGVVAVAGLVALPVLDQQMVPTFQERTLLIHWTAAPGTSHPEMSRITARVSAELDAISGVEHVGAHVGRAISSDEVTSINSGEIWVTLDKNANHDKAVGAVEDVVAGYPGIAHEVLTYIEERTIADGLGQGNSNELIVRVYGQDLTVLEEQAEAVRAAMADVNGVANTETLLEIEEPQLEIEVDLQAAQRFGVKPGEVRRAAAVLVSGIQVGSLFESQKIFEVMVWGDPATRHDPTSIKNLQIETPSGRLIRLGDVADVRFTAVPSVIQHDAVSRYIDVRATVGDRGLSAVAADIDKAIHAVDFPLEYHAEVRGDFAERQDSEQRYMVFALAGLIAIFLLFQACFGSWRLAAVAVATVPLALAGGLFGVALTGGDLEVGALVGFLAVTGIYVRNLIGLIRRGQEAAAGGGRLDTTQVIQVARDGVVPTVTTTVAVTLMMLPLIVSGSVPGQEILHPMAVVIVGGVISSTLVVLFALPFLYLRFAPDTPANLTDHPGLGRPALDPSAS
jgi:Cu/Ag efflux pump CusA